MKVINKFSVLFPDVLSATNKQDIREAAKVLIQEAGFFNICGWLSQKFGSNAASRIFFGWLTVYTKYGLNPA